MMKLKICLPRPGSHGRLGSLHFFVLLCIIVSSCHKERFQWKTRVKNTRELIVGIDSILRLEGVSKNTSYGYSPDDPVKLGVTDRNIALTYPYKYFSSLTGPQGEVVYFRRVKSCCPFKTVNSDEAQFQNLAVLEVYEVSYDGLKEPLRIYINFFDEGKVFAPKGFLAKSVNKS